ncbi:hypothetical protein AB0L63_00850 [Nocardia sp. NPDC051990]|uniref:hypothetical protein n=1 Tax=Nocardia sp. NPDC051990 TaxID=3155285 RepID=UPI0034190906
MALAPVLGEFGGIIGRTLDVVRVRSYLGDGIGNGRNTSRGQLTEIHPTPGRAHGGTDHRRIVIVVG